jgi:autotransporter-associated beta strand protein
VGGSGGLNPTGGGYGGGGGGFLGSGVPGGFGGGDGSTAGGGGGGAGLGGAIFVQAGGTLTVAGPLTINGSSVAAGLGGPGATDGSAYGAGMFLGGFGDITFAPGAGQTVTIADVIADADGASGLIGFGSRGLFKDGAGTLVLSGANQYSGSTTVLDGTLSINSDANLGVPGSSLFLAGPSTLELTGSNTFARDLFLDATNGNPTISVGSGVSATWSGVIAEEVPSGLRVTGGGTLSLNNAANSFASGLFVVGNSTVQFSQDAALGAAGSGVQLGDATSGGTLRLTSGNVFSDRTFTLGGTNVGTVDVTTGASLLLRGQVTGSGILAKAGAGTLVLSGANDYSGGTQVLAGTLQAGAADVFGTGRMDVRSGATLDLNTFGQTLGSLTGAGNVTLGSASLAAGTDNTSTTFSGVISGTGSFVKLGTGTLRLAGANTYAGGTTVSQGTLVGTTTSLQGNINNSGIVEFNQASAGTYGDVVSGTGSLVKSGVGTLTLLGANTYTGGTTISGGLLVGNTTSLQGNILNNAAIRFDQAATGTYGGVISGSGTFSKIGAGTLTLASSNTFTGAASIDAGTLRAGTTNVFSPTTAVSVASGATFDLNGFDQSIGTLSGGGNFALGSGTLTTGGDNGSATLSGVISGTGSLVKVGTGALTLSGANNYSGGTFVSQGTLIGTTASLQGNIQNSGVVEFNQGTTGTYAGSMGGTGSLTKSGTGTLTLTGTNTYTGGTTITGGTLVGTTSSLQGPITTNGLLVFNQAASGTFSGLIAGSGSLQKLGAGTLTLATRNTFTGGTTISGGVLRAGAANVFSSGGAISIGAGTTLDLHGFSHTFNALSGAGNVALGSATLTTGGSGSTTLSGVISGTGSLVKSGSGTLTLSGANTYSGGTTVSGGLLVGNTTSLHGSILNNARVVFSQGFSGTYAGAMSGTGILEKAGSGTLTLTGSNTYTGGTVISGGSVVATPTSLGGTIAIGGGLTFGGSTDGTFVGTVGGTGALNKTGSHTLTLNGTHPFSGLTTVLQGTLALNGTLGGSVTVAPGATFRANGTVLGTVNVNGTLSVPSSATPLSGFTSGAALAASTGDRLTTPPELTIGGNLVAGPDSVLALPIGPGVNPSLLVGGVAALNGTRLDATPIDLGTQRSLSFLALTAATGLTVANTTVDTRNPLLISALKQDGTSLFVTMLNLGVPLATAVSPNFSSVGAAIDQMKGNLEGDRGVVVRELLALTDDELDDAMRIIAGELHASNQHIVVRSSEMFSDLIRSEMTEREHEAEEGQPGWGGERIRWFGQFSREHASFDPTGGALGGGADLSDGAGGFEFRVSDRFLVGGGGGFGFGSMALDGLAAGTDFAAPRAFGILGFKPKAFSLRAGGSLARSKSKSKRAIFIIATLPLELGGGPLSGGIDREAVSEEVTVQSDQWGEYADREDFGTYRLDYMFGVRRARFARNGFTETGAGALSLRSDGETMNLTDTDVKIYLWRRKGGVRPYVETLVRRSSGFRYKLPVEFAADEDSDFETAGLPLGQNAFAGRMGVTFVRRIGSLTFEYRFRKASGQTVQSGDLRFRF